jgi:hypothetical protein
MLRIESPAKGQHYESDQCSNDDGQHSRIHEQTVTLHSRTGDSSFGRFANVMVHLYVADAT